MDQIVPRTVRSLQGEVAFDGNCATSVSTARGIRTAKPSILWLTGLSGAGKTTLAGALSALLRAEGRQVVVLDGDQLRAGLNRDLGFTPEDRFESMRRAAEVARLMADAGFIVIVALISPYRLGREEARRIAGSVPFHEIFVDTPHMICEFRDPKGLYARARQGQVAHFTSVSDPYEVPLAPDFVIKTHHLSVEQSAAQVRNYLAKA